MYAPLLSFENRYYFVAQAGQICQPHPERCWDYKCVLAQASSPLSSGLGEDISHPSCEVRILPGKQTRVPAFLTVTVKEY